MARKAATKLPKGFKSEPVKLKAGRSHRATFSADKRSGGYVIRVEGPQADKFAGKEVPVSLKDGSEHKEKLVRLIWTGADKESGAKIALYKFEAKPRPDAAADSEVKF